jgi:hypothetical protein
MEKIKKVVDGVEVWVVVEADGSETVIGPVDEAKPGSAADTTKGLTEEERIAAAIDARLKPIKEKLDKAYEARDAALKENTELKAKARDMELKALRDSGQEKEALTLELEELRRENENLRSSNTTLTRDTAIREALSGLKFRNEKASQLAFKDIANVLKKGEDGRWLTPEGDDVKTAVQKFADNEQNSFLFAAKENRGTGSSSHKSTDSASNDTKGLRSRTTAELLEMARQGKLRK